MTRATATFLLLPLSGLFFIGYTHAAGAMNPGLWEINMQSDAMKSMPKMPPAQIEQMKKMGVKVPVMQDGMMKSTVCITEEMRGQNPAVITQKNQAGCQPQNIIENGNEYSMELHCNNPELKGIAVVKGNYNTAKNVRSNYDFKGTSYGKPITHHMVTTGKWLSSVCGDVKPIGSAEKSR